MKVIKNTMRKCMGRRQFRFSLLFSFQSHAGRDDDIQGNEQDCAPGSKTKGKVIRPTGHDAVVLIVAIIFRAAVSTTR